MMGELCSKLAGAWLSFYHTRGVRDWVASNAPFVLYEHD